MRTRIPTEAEKFAADSEKEFRAAMPGLKVDMALKRVMADRDGRAVMRWLICECGFERTSFSTNALSMAFSEGRRSVGLTIADRLKRVVPEDFILMQEEGNE